MLLALPRLLRLDGMPTSRLVLAQGTEVRDVELQCSVIQTRDFWLSDCLTAVLDGRSLSAA